MAGDATPPSSPPPPAPELPPGLLAEYLESARAQLGVLAGLAERLVVTGGDRDALDALRRETHKVHGRSEEHTSELQSPCNLVCRLLLEKKKTRISHCARS